MKKGLIVHAAVINNNKILILKRAEGTYLGGLWDFPGGTLEDGEAPEKGARREIYEETGLKLTKVALFYCHSKVDQKNNKQFVTLVFLSESGRKNVKINPKEHGEYCWIKLGEIKSYRTVDYLPACAEYLKNQRLSRLIP